MTSANQAAPVDQGEGESEALGGMLYGGMLSMVIFYGDILKLPCLFTFLSYTPFYSVSCAKTWVEGQGRS